MGKFKKGVLFGSVIGAALVWLNSSAKGKKYRAQLFDHAADVYRQVETTIQKSDAYDAFSKSRYVALVREAVEKYGDEHGLAKEAKDMLVTLVSSQWTSIKKQINK